MTSTKRTGAGATTHVGPAATAGPAPYFAGLDGLRGLAVIAVVLYHAGVPWMPGGFLGVSVFFTLSGFLITSLLLREHHTHGRIDRRAFWNRRFRRLLPAALAGIVLATAFTIAAGTPAQQVNFRGDALASLTYVANWWFIHEGSAYGALSSAPSALQHYWSLSIEEQFYVVFPLVVPILLARRRALSWLAAALVAVVASSTAVAAFGDLDPLTVYLGTATRLAEIAVGALLAVAYATAGRLEEPTARTPRGRTAIATTGAAALILVVCSFVEAERTDSWVTGGGLSLYALVSAAVIVAAISPGPVATVLAARPVQRLGHISYGVYLYHWPLLLWLLPGGVEGDGVLRMLLAITGTLALAVASYRWLEQPIRRRSAFGARSMRIAAPAAMAAVAGLVLVANSAEPDSPALQLAQAQPGELVVDRGAMPTRPPALDTGGATRPDESDDPGPGAPGTPPPIPDRPLHVVVVGDSTAIALTASLQRWGEETGAWGVTGYGRSGCAIARGGSIRHWGIVVPVPDHCARWADDWTALLAAEDPDLVVVSTGVTDLNDHLLPGEHTWRAVGDPTYDAFLEDELADAADVLSSSAAPVVWLTVGPVLDGIARQPPDTDWPVNDPDRADRYNELIQTMAEQRSSVQVVDLAGFYTTWPGGPFDLALRDDGLHLNGTPAAQDPVNAWLGPELLSAYQELATGTSSD